MDRGTWSSSSPSAHLLPHLPSPQQQAPERCWDHQPVQEWIYPPSETMAPFSIGKILLGLGEEPISWDPITLRTEASHNHPKGLGLEVYPLQEGITLTHPSCPRHGQ